MSDSQEPVPAELTDEQIQELADEAEAGYDIERLRPRYQPRHAEPDPDPGRGESWPRGDG